MDQEQTPVDIDISKIRAYKSVCAKLGLTMCVYFLCRMLTGGTAILLDTLTGAAQGVLFSLLYSTSVVILVYVLPLLFAVLIFRSNKKYKGKVNELYQKPKRLAEYRYRENYRQDR